MGDTGTTGPTPSKHSGNSPWGPHQSPPNAQPCMGQWPQSWSEPHTHLANGENGTCWTEWMKDEHSTGSPVSGQCSVHRKTQTYTGGRAPAPFTWKQVQFRKYVTPVDFIFWECIYMGPHTAIFVKEHQALMRQGSVGSVGMRVPSPRLPGTGSRSLKQGSDVWRCPPRHQPASAQPAPLRGRPRTQRPLCMQWYPGGHHWGRLFTLNLSAQLLPSASSSRWLQT